MGFKSKINLSLKTRLILVMVLVISLQSFALLSSLKISGVFDMIDQNAFRVFSTATENQVQKINKDTAHLMTGLADTSNILSSTILKSSDNFTGDSEKYDETMLAGSKILLNILRDYEVTGAFFILDESDKDIKQFLDNKYSGTVYIKSFAPDLHELNIDNMTLESGSVNLLKRLKIPSAVDWPSSKWKYERLKDQIFYKNPMSAAEKYPNSELIRYGYWGKPINLLEDYHQAVTYTIPLVDKFGHPFGVIGVEIENTFFSMNYIFTLAAPYKQSFYVVGQVKDKSLYTDWLISQNPFGEQQLRGVTQLSFSHLNNFGVYEASLDKMGDLYCSVIPLEMYSKNSPFYNDRWSLVGCVKKKVLRSNSSDIRSKLWSIILYSALFSSLCVFILAYLSTRKITALTEYLSTVFYGEPIKFAKTGMKEIDDLTSAIEALNREVHKASETMSNVLNMTKMPIGGFEIKEDSKYVIVTDYIYKLLHLDKNVAIKKDEWNKIHDRLLKNPAKFEDVYIFTSKDGETYYLRISEEITDNRTLGVIVDVSEDVKSQVHLITQLEHDALTGLYNRTAFYSKVDEIISEGPDMVGAMIFADLDNLKYVNDTYGHESGDMLIKKAGEHFGSLSDFDAIVARISGDEFAIFLHGFGSKESAEKIINAQLLNTNTKYISVPDGTKVALRYSSGIAWYPKDSKTSKTLLKYADFTMYEAKKNEKGAMYQFDYKIYTKNKYIFENTEAINNLLTKELIHFAFQPIINLKDCSIYSYEALMRSSEDNFKSPLEILNVAHFHSKLKPLERIVFKLAFKAISENLDKLGNAKVFINSIPKYMIGIDELEIYKKEYPVDLTNVVIEVTETECDFLSSFSENIVQLRKSGIKFAIDDFGKGHSGELRVINLDPSIVKLDMDLIIGISDNLEKRNLITSLIEFFHTKDILIVAEGVETRKDLETLIDLGVDLAQGFYIAKPSTEIKAIESSRLAEIKETIQFKKNN